VRVLAAAPRPQAAPALYDGDRLFEEIAYIAYHFHWPLAEILDLEHPLRRRFVEEIARINRRRAEEE
jgi:hypothetical protein